MASVAVAKTPTKLSATAAAGPKTPSKPSAAAKTPAKPSAAARTPVKPSPTAAVKIQSKSASRAQLVPASENSDPNILCSPPPPASKTPAKSPGTASTRKNRCTPAPAPPPLIPQRRFLVAKKGARRRHNGVSGGGGGFDFDKCRDAAREALRASQEEFFRKEHAATLASEEKLQMKKEEEVVLAEDEANNGVFEDQGKEDAEELQGSSKVRAIRSRVMEKALNSVPDSGAGRVKHLVEAFESLLSISGATSDSDRAGEASWALPGLQPWKEEGEGGVGIPTVSAFSSSDFLNTGPSRLGTSPDGNSDSWDSGTSAGGRRSRRNSSESLRSSWNKKLKVTSQHPFKLRTEQRGRAKEQEFIQKVQEMLMEDEKKRIHIAQGLPWTTDEPECLVKPPVKERTEPVDLVLHSDVRAVERAEFDQFVSERIKFGEQLRLEREQQQKLEEEEMIRQLRKELVPKAQPMPYFDRPFIPKRSSKSTTIPKEPSFHIRPEKLSCYCRQRCMDPGKLKASSHEQCECQLHRQELHRHA